MSIKDLFNKGIPKVVSSQTPDSGYNLQGTEVESFDYASERSLEKSRFIPDIDFSSASSFARYGLAEEYYKNSFKRVYQQFPYDGSRKEKTQFDNESTFLDKHIIDKVYPLAMLYFQQMVGAP